MKWRIIPLETHDAFMNMATDHALVESIAKGGSPTIRFYRWQPSAVSIGYFQSLDAVVDKKICKEQKVDIVRRQTGGGAVFHSFTGEITYSVIGKKELFAKNIIESYKEICGWVIQGLAQLGLDASFVPINDIIVAGKKISGNAQTRKKDVLLQHGTILYDVDVDKMFSLLKVPDEKIKDKIIKVVKDRVTCIKHFDTVSLEETYEALLKGFTMHKEWEFGTLTQEEKERALDISLIKYRTKAWNAMK